MEKTILFIMHTGIIGQGLHKNFQDNKEYHPVLTSDYKNAELYLCGKTPETVVIEVPDHSLYPLSYCLEVGKRLKKAYPSCQVLLFLSYTYLDDILPVVVEAKRAGEIDGFTTANARIEEVIATIKSLG